MKNILVIAKNTFREAVRDRILYGLLGFSLIYVALTSLLARVSLNDIVVLKSFGLAGIYLFGSIITIFLGASLIYKEIERRTLYFVLSKPVSRLDIVLGKFLGLFLAIVVVTLAMTLVYLGVIALNGGGFDYLSLLAILFQLFEAGLVIALLAFFSTISTPLTATIIGVMVLFVGHSMDTLLQNAAQAGGFVYGFVQFIYYVFPNLEKFNLRNLVVHGLSISPSLAVFTFIYAVLYIVLLLYLANAFLKRKEL